LKAEEENFPQKLPQIISLKLGGELGSRHKFHTRKLKNWVKREKGSWPFTKAGSLKCGNKQKKQYNAAKFD
jgi:hypothetical protein